MNRLLCTRSKRLVCKFEVAIQCMHCKCTKLQMFEYLFPFTVFCERAHLKWLEFREDCSEIFGGFLVLMCDVPWFNVLSFYGYRCHPGFIGIRCEHADLLAVVATNQRQQTLATILMLAILGILLLVLLCTVIKYGIYLGYPIILISCIYFFRHCNIHFMYCVHEAQNFPCCLMRFSSSEQHKMGKDWIRLPLTFTSRISL